MSARLIQLHDKSGERVIAALDDTGTARKLTGVASTYDLALAALAAGTSLAHMISRATQRRT